MKFREQARKIDLAVHRRKSDFEGEPTRAQPWTLYMAAKARKRSRASGEGTGMNLLRGG